MDCRSGGLHDCDREHPLLACRTCGRAHPQQLALLDAGLIDGEGNELPCPHRDRSPHGECFWCGDWSTTTTEVN